MNPDAWFVGPSAGVLIETIALSNGTPGDPNRACVIAPQPDRAASVAARALSPFGSTPGAVPTVTPAPAWNVAVTALAPFIVTWQPVEPVPVHAPLHPVNVQPGDGLAGKVARGADFDGACAGVVGELGRKEVGVGACACARAFRARRPGLGSFGGSARSGRAAASCFWHAGLQEWLVNKHQSFLANRVAKSEKNLPLDAKWV